jgi:transposase InsO family protein
LITSPNGLKLCPPSTTPLTLQRIFSSTTSYPGLEYHSNSVSDHGKHFENEIFVELSSRLGFSHEFASPYYPQSNGQVEAVNKVLKTMLQRTVNKHKTNWHHMLFSALWAYRTAVKTATGFTPFHLVHGIEATLPIECEIPTLRTAIELLPDTAPMEQRLLNLESLDEDRRSSLQNNEAAKK